MIRIQKGLVKYKDRSDIVCTYGISDDGRTYYFLDGEKLSNGHIIASTVLVEAIDPLVVASNIGVINAAGDEVVPFENKSIRPVNDKFLLIEAVSPVTQSVIDSLALRKDPLSATKLVTTSAAIKDKMYKKMGVRGRFLFNDQFSEVALCDLDGKNLYDGKRFSFVGINDDTLYLSGNTVEDEVFEYSLNNKEVVQNENSNPALDVREAVVSKDSIDNAMDSEVKNSNVDVTLEENSNNDNQEVALENQGLSDNSVLDNTNINNKINEEAVDKEVSFKDDFGDIDLEQKEIKPANFDTIKAENEFDVPSNQVLNTDFSNLISSNSDEDEGEEKSKKDDYDRSFSFDSDMKFSDNFFDNDLDSNIDDKDFSINIDREIPNIKNKVIFDDDSLDEKDTVFSDAALVMSKMISQIEEMRQSVSDYENKLKKLSDFRHKALEENKKLVHRYEGLFQEYKKLESTVEYQQRLIDEQQEKIESLKNQVAGKNELVKLLARAQSLLDEDSYDMGFAKTKRL